MHHEQDMRNMGGLAKYMPITYITMLIGSLALAGIPPFAGFFSKDMILESAQLAYANGLPGGAFAVFTVYASVFVTAIYSFSLIFMTFHGKERFRSNHAHEHSYESQNASHHESDMAPQRIPMGSYITTNINGNSISYDWLVGLELFVSGKILDNSVFNIAWYMEHIGHEVITPIDMIIDSFTEPPVYFAIIGIFTAWIFHRIPHLSTRFVHDQTNLCVDAT